MIFLGVLLVASLFTAIGSYLDKYLVNLGISRDDYFYYMCLSMLPFTLLMMFFEYISNTFYFHLNLIPVLLLIVAMFLRYYKQHTIVGYLKYLNPYEASAYLSLGLIIAFIIDCVLGLEKLTILSTISFFLTVFGVFLLSDTRLKITQLKRDLLIKIFTSLCLGYVTHFILQYWSSATFMFVMNLFLTLLFSKKYSFSYHKEHKKIITWVFVQQIFGFFTLYLGNFLLINSVSLSYYVKPVSFVFVFILAFFLHNHTDKLTIKKILAIFVIAIGLILINY